MALGLGLMMIKACGGSRVCRRWTPVTTRGLSALARAVGLPVFGAQPGAGSSLIRVGRKYYMYVNQAIFDNEMAWFEDVLHTERDAMGYIRYG